MTLLVFLSTIILSKLTEQIVAEGEKNFYDIANAMSYVVGTAFTWRLTYYMSTAQGGDKYLKLLRDTLEYYALTLTFPKLVRAIVDAAATVALVITPSAKLEVPSHLDTFLSFPGITVNLMLFVKWIGIMIGTIAAEMAHGLHSAFIYVILSSAQIFIFSHTMFSFTISFPILLGFLTVLSLWPLSAALCAKVGDGIYHIATRVSPDSISVITLGVIYAGVSLLTLFMPFLLFKLAFGYGPKEAGKTLYRQTAKFAQDSHKLIKTAFYPITPNPEDMGLGRSNEVSPSPQKRLTGPAPSPRLSGPGSQSLLGGPGSYPLLSGNPDSPSPYLSGPKKSPQLPSYGTPFHFQSFGKWFDSNPSVESIGLAPARAYRAISNITPQDRTIPMVQEQGI